MDAEYRETTAYLFLQPLQLGFLCRCPLLIDSDLGIYPSKNACTKSPHNRRPLCQSFCIPASRACDNIPSSLRYFAFASEEPRSGSARKGNAGSGGLGVA